MKRYNNDDVNGNYKFFTECVVTNAEYQIIDFPPEFYGSQTDTLVEKTERLKENFP